MLTLVTLAFLLQAESGELPALSPEAQKVSEAATLPSPTGPTSVRSIVRPDAITPDLAMKLEAEVRKALAATGLDVQSDDVTKQRLGGRDAIGCSANTSCYSLLATVSRTPLIVVVEASAVQEDLAVVLQAIDAAEGKLVAEESLVLPSSMVETGVGPQLSAFANKVRTASATATPVIVPDAPVQAKLVPEEKPVIVAPAPPPTPSRVPAVITGVGAVAAATVAIIFAANAVSSQSCLNGPAVEGRPSVCVPQNRAADLQGEINRDYAIAGGSAVVAAALAIVTSRLWSAD